MKDCRKITVHVPEPLLAGIERARRGEARTASDVVRDALVVYLDDLGYIKIDKIKPESLQDGRGRWKRKK